MSDNDNQDAGHKPNKKKRVNLAENNQRKRKTSKVTRKIGV